MKCSTHEEYFATLSPESAEILKQIQAEVESLIPDSIRCIAYGMPAFRQKRTFFYFAAFKKHIGIYPPLTDDASIIEATQAYRGPKGNLSFPFAKKIPVQLIGKVAVALSGQYAKS